MLITLDHVWYIGITKHEVTNYNHCVVHFMREMKQLRHGLSVSEVVSCAFVNVSTMSVLCFTVLAYIMAMLLLHKIRIQE